MKRTIKIFLLMMQVMLFTGHGHAMEEIRRGLNNIGQRLDAIEQQFSDYQSFLDNARKRLGQLETMPIQQPQPRVTTPRQPEARPAKSPKPSRQPVSSSEKPYKLHTSQQQETGGKRSFYYIRLEDYDPYRNTFKDFMNQEFSKIPEITDVNQIKKLPYTLIIIKKTSARPGDILIEKKMASILNTVQASKANKIILVFWNTGLRIGQTLLRRGFHLEDLDNGAAIADIASPIYEIVVDTKGTFRAGSREYLKEELEKLMR